MTDWKRDDAEEKAAYDRMSTLLRFPGSDQTPEAIENLGKYSMGTKRSYEQYIEFSGIDPIHRKLDTPDKHCIVYHVDWDDSDWKKEYEAKKQIQKVELSKRNQLLFGPRESVNPFLGASKVTLNIKRP